MKNKKAQAMDMVKKIILAVLVLVILMIILGKVYDYYSAYLREQTCKGSIAANAEGRIIVKGSDFTNWYGQLVEIKCTTNYIEVDAKEEKEMKDELALAMAKCWDYYGKDGYEIFDTKDNSYCVVCSRLEFKHPKPLTDFSQYLMNATYKGETIFEYVYGFKPKKPSDLDLEQIGEHNANMDTINTENPIGVIFFMAKDAHVGKSKAAIAGLTAGAVVGVAAGAVLTYTGVLAPIGIPLTVKSAAVLGIAGGGAIGYMIGSEKTSDFGELERRHILLWPYDNIKDLDCTYLEGKSRKGLQVVE